LAEELREREQDGLFVVEDQEPAGRVVGSGAGVRGEALQPHGPTSRATPLPRGGVPRHSSRQMTVRPRGPAPGGGERRGEPGGGRGREGGGETGTGGGARRAGGGRRATASRARDSGAAGRNTVKTAPATVGFPAVREPPWASTSRWAIARPMPVPPLRRLKKG